MPTEPSSKPDLDALPTAPSRGSAGSVFRAAADAFLSALVTFRTQMAALATWVSDTAQEVYDNAVEANAAAAAALASANATEWVSAASYTQGDQVWSPVDFLTYRAKTTHSGETTDPSSDTTNWRLSVGDGYAPIDSPAFTNNPTAPTQTAGDNSTKLATTAYVDAKPSGAWALVSEADIAANTASVTFDLSTGSVFMLVCNKVFGDSAEGDLGIQLSDDGGSTFITSGYIAAQQLGDGTYGGGSGTSARIIAGKIGTDIDNCVCSVTYLYLPATATGDFHMFSHGVARAGAGDDLFRSTISRTLSFSAVPDFCRLIVEAGELEGGSVHMYRLLGS